MSYDRHLASQELKEELEMEAEEVREAKMDAKVDDYIRFALSARRLETYRGTEVPQWAYEFEWEIWPDWLDTIDSNLINLVRLNLLAGEPEKAGQAMVESLQEYMREIALQAVRDKEG